MSSQILLIEALAATDAGGLLAAPAAVLVRRTRLPADPGRRHRCELLAAGPAQEIRRHPLAAEAVVISRPMHLLVPGLVNAHAHLDLTDIGPRPHDPKRGFVEWIRDVRDSRPTSETDVEESVRHGTDLSLAGGVVALGDIAGAVNGRLCPWAAEALMMSPLSGVSFLEFFAVGRSEEVALASLREIAHDIARSAAEGDPVRLGLQPHAPYSVSLRAYQIVAEFARPYGVRLATHLAESPEERRLVTEASGPLADLLDEVGAWDDSLLGAFDNPGLSPVRLLEPMLRHAPFAAAHLNDVDDDDLAVLAACKTSVVYCPRASAYFGADEHFGPHRYRDMLAAGINVALGTDSIINLPPAAADPAKGGISTLDEMRLLFRRDGTDPLTLLAMATVNGARALGLHPQGFGFRSPISSAIGGVVGIPLPDGTSPEAALKAALSGDARPEILALGSV